MTSPLPHQPPRLTLAPLQGLTEAPYRALLQQIGGVDAFVTPFVRVSHQRSSEVAIFKEMPELRHPERMNSSPLTFLQLLGSEPEPMAETARLAVELGARGIDLNFGCPDNRVNRHHGGAALLKHPHLIERVVCAVRLALPQQIPVSAKIRLGWDSSEHLLDIVQAAEQGGASWITVHGRTREQRYEGHADWRAIGRARLAASVPIIANGDIDSPASLSQCERQSGCQHFMIGRGALVVPELFLLLSNRQTRPWSAGRRAELLLRYLDERTRWGMSDYAAIGRVKGLAVYLARGHRDLAELFDTFKVARDVDEARRILTTWLRRRSDV